MGKIYLDPLRDNEVASLQTAFNQLEDQVNEGATLSSLSGTLDDEQHGSLGGGNLHAVATDSEAGFMSATDKVKLDNYLGDTSAAGPATITQYPNDGNWGFHTDTAGATYSLAKNKAGTIYTTLLT